MENEDKEIRDLFSEFNPRLKSTENDFMERLNRSMDSVEMLCARRKAMNRRNRVASAAAGLVGFVAGFVMALLLPTISGLFGRLIESLPDLSVVERRLVADVLSYIVIGVLTVSASLATYEGVRRRQTARV